MAILAGWLGAVLHFAGALKSTPAAAALPFDLTLAAIAVLLPLLALLLFGRGWRLRPALGLPLAAAGALWLWWVVAAAWGAWGAGVADRLPELVLAGPVMLAAGLLLGAEPAARQGFVVATVAVGLFVAASLAWGLANDALVLGGEAGGDPSRVRVAYQVAGLSVATGAGVSALRAAAAGSAVARGVWLLLAVLLGAGVLLPGGRAALAAAGLVAVLAPAVFLALSGRAGLAILWGVGTTVCGGLALFAVLDDPGRAAGFATLERLTRDTGDAPGARRLLWGEAWRLSGLFGLGPGGFPPAAGFGQDRGFHPHNHAIEALVEGGVPGLALWLAAFGGGALVFLFRMGRIEPLRAATILALVLPMALTAMVSTDLGNRMAWLSLGLALSVALDAERV